VYAEHRWGTKHHGEGSALNRSAPKTTGARHGVIWIYKVLFSTRDLGIPAILSSPLRSRFECGHSTSRVTGGQNAGA
jgi:hypothetical protein